MSKIPKLTLWQILSNEQVSRILIPRIQRDYAHGRDTSKAEEIRTALINDLIGSLEMDETAPRTDLGLIFGSENSEHEMTLYDGQQRFTTLFLLHWCLAWLSRDISAAKQLGRFSYNSRLHSRDFCRVLTADGLNLEPNGTCPSQRFPDEPWFCPEWCTDPTVAGMLKVLDLIHARLIASEEEATRLWERMKSNGAPCISWLKLEEDAGSEDLYVKLNSRGRTLSEIEKLKAWLEEFIKKNEASTPWQNVTLPTNWKRKLDNAWLDLFWKESGACPETMDRCMLACFLGNVLNLTIATKGDLKDEIIKKVHQREFLSKKDWTQLFTPESLPRFFQALDYLTEKKIRHQIDEWAANSRILVWTKKDSLTKAWIAGWIDAVTYADRLLFYGFVRFLIENPPDSPGWDATTFHRWMRFVRNLCANTNPTNETLSNAVQSIQAIAPDGLQALDDWLSKEPTRPCPEGIDKAQWHDEIIKSKLRIRRNCEKTNAALDAAEDQAFLRGQIGFLITFASSKEGSFDLRKFEGYAETMHEHFRDEPKKDQRILLQQALLSLGDYEEGDGKKRLGSGRDGWLGWRNIFASESKRHKEHLDNPEHAESALKTLLDLGPTGDLKALVQAKLQNLSWENWRKWLLSSMHPLSFCEKSVFEIWESGQAALLIKGSDYRSSCVELRTFFIFKEILKDEGWDYTKNLGRHSHIFQNKGFIRLELHNRSGTDFVLRLLTKEENYNLPQGFQLASPESPLRLREDMKNDWNECYLKPLDACFAAHDFPQRIAKQASDEWSILTKSGCSIIYVS